MLKPEEFIVGTLTSATAGLSLVLPRSRYEHAILTVCEGDVRTAVFLEGPYEFATFSYDANESWKGLVISGVRLELDETSLFDPDEDYPPFGALVRELEVIGIVADDRERGRGARPRVPLVTGLPRCPDRFRAGFRKWQIVIGEQLEKRVLRTMTLGPPTQ